MLIKVCGLADAENAGAVSRLDIDMLGFIFWPKSKRYCIIPCAQITALKFRQKKVGVFVNATEEDIMEKSVAYGLDFVQLHGDETPDFCRKIQSKGLPVIKAIPISSEHDLEKASAYEKCASFLLFDTKCEGYGGSGRTFDWSILNTYSGAIPFLLSGGINPGSAEAIRRFRHPQLAGIDLNSGFELSPGLKDVEKVRGFVGEMRGGRAE
jgi:phosphoribosylanthranilate isomerase